VPSDPYEEIQFAETLLISDRRTNRDVMSHKGPSFKSPTKIE
jgi:hypothetical protein